MNPETARQIGRNIAKRFSQAGGSGGGGFGGNANPGGRGTGGPGLLLPTASGAFLLGGGLILLNSALFNVEGGHRAIKYTRLNGVSPDVYAEGTHFVIPWFERIVTYDVRAKPTTIASLTGTKDLQMVNITCRVLARPQVNKLAEIYKTLGTDYDQRVLPSIVNEVLKSVVAQFNASQLITQREMVSRLIRESLSRRADLFNIVLDDVSLTHVTFSPAFSDAVEAKQIAQQNAQRAVYLVDQAIQEKQSIIVRAQGEAKSAELIGEAIKKNKGFLQLRRLEAAREIANVAQQSQNKFVLDSGALLLNVNENESDEGRRR